MTEKQDYLDLQMYCLNTLSPANIIQRRCQTNKRVRIIIGNIMTKKTEVLEEKPIPVTLCVPQIQRGREVKTGPL